MLLCGLNCKNSNIVRTVYLRQHLGECNFLCVDNYQKLQKIKESPIPFFPSIVIAEVNVRASH